jgi:hypothetical protein
MAYGATHHRAGHRVVSRQVPCDTSHSSALDAAMRIRDDRQPGYQPYAADQQNASPAYRLHSFLPFHDSKTRQEEKSSAYFIWRCGNSGRRHLSFS